VSTFAAGGKLNAPWGLAETPAGFGAFPNAILVGNFGDGTINAFDSTGKFLGQLSDASGKALVNPGLWDLTFGGGGTSGDLGTLYITAGGSNQPNFPAGGSTTAVFASLVPAAAVGSPDFSLNISSQTASVMQGGSATLKVSASAVGGFNGLIGLTCSAPAGLTCAFSPNSISPGSSASSSTLTISAASTPPSTGYVMTAMNTLLPGFGVLGTVLVGGRKKWLSRKSVLWISLALVILVSLFALGCGGGSSNKSMNPTASQVNLMVTGTSGSITHSSVVSITIQ
jgi:hypothetical protein